jgi:hypothetical protein
MGKNRTADAGCGVDGGKHPPIRPEHAVFIRVNARNSMILLIYHRMNRMNAARSEHAASVRGYPSLARPEAAPTM